MPGSLCVGYAYVPWQMLNEVYTPEKGLNSGTVFPELALTMEEYGNVCKSGGA
ncbi:MAG: spore coat associated protein CotJA [Oscillospiraceae bacterium]|nr:spore coat associated protein CotJA [Oscillospiraceae bacterium]